MVLIPTYFYDNWRDIQNKLEENRCKTKVEHHGHNITTP